GFESAENDLRRGIARHPGDAISDIDVTLVARGDEAADADATLTGETHGVAAEIAALRYDAERAGRRHAVFEHDRERRNALLDNADRAAPVRAQQTHAAVARGKAQPILHRTSLLAELSESRGEHDNAADAAHSALLDGFARALGVNGDDGEIRCLRQVG